MTRHASAVSSLYGRRGGAARHRTDPANAAAQLAELTEEDMCCRACGNPMTVLDNGVSHHLSIATGRIDYRLDVDHVAAPEIDLDDPSAVRPVECEDWGR